MTTKSPSKAKSYLKALRPHQWAKNSLLALPLLTAHAFNATSLWSIVMAFVAFSMAASGTYIFNDLMDLESDRGHATKKHRPFASGAIPLRHGYVAIPILLLGALYIGSLINLSVVGLLSTYLVANIFYTTYLKKLIIADVIILSGFYALRVFTGAAAIEVVISPWLMMFSLFLFLSLAIIKRLVELVLDEATSTDRITRRGYDSRDIPMLSALGAGAGFSAVLVIGLYINSDNVRILYDRPEALWFICPLLVYWISRALILAQRGEMNGDPVIFALTDRASHVVAVLGMIVVALAMV